MKSNLAPVIAEALVCGLAITFCILPFLVAFVLPMTDVSQHVLVARIISSYADQELRYLDSFVINWGGEPGGIFYAALATLQRVTSPYVDVQIYLISWVVAMYFSVRWLAKKHGWHRRRASEESQIVC